MSPFFNIIARTKIKLSFERNSGGKTVFTVDLGSRSSYVIAKARIAKKIGNYAVL